MRKKPLDRSCSFVCSCPLYAACFGSEIEGDYFYFGILNAQLRCSGSGSMFCVRCYS